MDTDYYSTPQKWKFETIKRLYLNNSSTKQSSKIDFSRYDNLSGIDREKVLLQEISERINLPDKAAIEVAVNFIGEQVYFHYSGYIKESMARRLKNCDALSQTQISRIISGVTNLISSGNVGSEFKQLKKLLDYFNNGS